jgi:hypothetical protein
MNTTVEVLEEEFVWAAVSFSMMDTDRGDRPRARATASSVSSELWPRDTWTVTTALARMTHTHAKG